MNLRSTFDGFAPLHCAAHGGNVDLIELLLDRGCNPNEKNTVGSTALFWASSSDALLLLLDRGANINEKNTNGNTVFIAASFQGRREVVELLIGRGANIAESNNAGNDAIIAASSSGHKDILEILLSKCSTSHENVIRTIMVASKNKHEEIVDILSKLRRKIVESIAALYVFIGSGEGKEEAKLEELNEAVAAASGAVDLHFLCPLRQAITRLGFFLIRAR